MGPLTRYYWILAALVSGGFFWLVVIFATPSDYISIPILLLILWFGVLTLKLSDVSCQCGLRLDLSMSWLRGWPKPECPGCGRDLREP